jgi:TatD DNase family protein
MPLVDSHCHLDYTPLVEDRAGVVTRAREAGVVRMVNIATTRKDFPQVRATAELFDDVYCSAGVHPHHVAEEGESLTIDDLIAFASHEKVVGIGETGLDYHYDHSPRDIQAASFHTHLRACVALGLPAIVHSREAEQDTAKILKEESAGGKLTGVMHCFSSCVKFRLTGCWSRRIHPISRHCPFAASLVNPLMLFIRRRFWRRSKA